MLAKYQHAGERGLGHTQRVRPRGNYNNAWPDFCADQTILNYLVPRVGNNSYYPPGGWESPFSPICKRTDEQFHIKSAQIPKK